MKKVFVFVMFLFCTLFIVSCSPRPVPEDVITHAEVVDRYIGADGFLFIDHDFFLVFALQGEDKNKTLEVFQPTYAECYIGDTAVITYYWLSGFQKVRIVCSDSVK